MLAVPSAASHAKLEMEPQGSHRRYSWSTQSVTQVLIQLIHTVNFTVCLSIQTVDGRRMMGSPYTGQLINKLINQFDFSSTASV